MLRWWHCCARCPLFGWPSFQMSQPPVKLEKEWKRVMLIKQEESLQNLGKLWDPRSLHFYSLVNITKNVIHNTGGSRISRRRGTNLKGGGANLLYWSICPNSAWKWKKKWTPGDVPGTSVDHPMHRPTMIKNPRSVRSTHAGSLPQNWVKCHGTRVCWVVGHTFKVAKDEFWTNF